VRTCYKDTSCSAESLFARTEGVTGLDVEATGGGDLMEWVLRPSAVPSAVTEVEISSLFIAASLDSSRILIAGLTSSGLGMQQHRTFQEMVGK